MESDGGEECFDEYFAEGGAFNEVAVGRLRDEGSGEEGCRGCW